MTLQKKFIWAMASIGLLVLLGLSIILKSSLGVSNASKQQLSISQTQNELVGTLTTGADAIAPSLETMNQLSLLAKQIAKVRFLYVQASITQSSEDLDSAKRNIEIAQKTFLTFLNSSKAKQSEITNVQDAFSAAAIFGNKMIEFNLKGLSMVAGEMATGLSFEIDKLEAILEKRSLRAGELVQGNIASVLGAIDSVENSAKSLKVNSQQISNNAETVTQIVIFVAVVMILVSSSLTYALNSSLKKATKQVVSKLSEITKNKNLSLRINRQQQDELGEIAHDVDTMMSTFEEVVRQVSSTAHQVNSEIESMSERGHNLNQLVDQQGRALEDISASITEMSASAEHVAENANSTMSTSQNANEAGKKGSEIIRGNIQSIDSLSQQLQDSESKINQLADDVASIGDISLVIESIAQQTNLLALNAAIESARAGEHGRGFAVVADEVRTLAKRTQSSIDEIKSSIESLTHRTGEAVHSVQSSRQTSIESVEKAQQTNEVVSTIIESLREITDRISQITTSANEQSRVSSEITARVNEISGKSSEIVAHASKNQAGGQRMSAQGNKLHELISVFTLN